MRRAALAIAMAPLALTGCGEDQFCSLIGCTAAVRLDVATGRLEPI
jgi:hypothetical protein